MATPSLAITPSLPVDAVEISIIVDNNIERFATLPHGFQDETAVQLGNNPPIDTHLTGLPIIDLDNYCCGAHGLALLVTTRLADEQHTVLFDAGPEGKSFQRNAEALKLDMGKVERVILSHWHADHSNGIPAALKLISKATTSETPVPVDVHPARPIARANAPPPTFVPKTRQPEGPTFEDFAACHGIAEPHLEAHNVANDTIFVSGEIPRITDFETGFLGGIQWKEDGTWDKEAGTLVMDERYIVVDVRDKGLVIFSACSHAGIVNVTKDALKHFPGRPVHLVIGGLHLGGKDMECRIQPTVDYFAHQLEIPPTYVLPLHCTGFNARMALTSALGAECVIAGGTGMRITLSAESKKRVLDDSAAVQSDKKHKSNH